MLNRLKNYKQSSIETLISKKSVNYIEAIKFMEKRVDGIINKKKSNLIWMLFHPKIYTVGKSSKKEDFIKKPIIPVHHTNRGGQITYHGPGQRIIYLMIDINKKKDVRYFIRLIEKIIIETLQEFNITAESRKDRIGIWVTKINNKFLKKEKKIASIGIRIKKWVSYHGISINICPDLSYFKYINPCGIKNFGVTSFKDLGLSINLNEFDKIILKKLKKHLIFK